MARIHLFGALFVGVLFSGGTAAFDVGPPLPPGMADLETTAGFRRLGADHRVHYEQGAFGNALVTARLIDAAVRRVEQVHGRPFLFPAEVFICATMRSFVRLSPTASALVYRGRVYLSPDLFRTPERVAGILIHELSHLHFVQHLGAERASANLPPWFREGLAVHVAGGAGAERVSEAAATGAILAGHAFTPNEHSDPLFARNASDFGLQPHMFYRQAAMFVAYLDRGNPDAFDRLLENLLDGTSMLNAFQRVYGRRLPALWAAFKASLMRTHARPNR